MVASIENTNFLLRVRLNDSNRPYRDCIRSVSNLQEDTCYPA